MSRGFFGGAGGGGSSDGGGGGKGLFGSFGPKSSGTKASDTMKKNMMGKKGGPGINSLNKYGKTDYNEMMSQRIEQYKTQMMTEARSGGSFTLPGTDPNQTNELSEGAKEIIRQMAEKKARSEAKKQKMIEGLRPKQDPKKGPLNFLSQTVGGVADNGRSGDGRGPLYNDDR